MSTTGRPWLTVSYCDRGEGRFQPDEGVNRCPFAGPGEVCRLRKHSFRKRSTGPGFPLRVMFCNDHAQYFSLYPVGFVPYARKPLAPVDITGFMMEPAERPFEQAEEFADDKRWLARTSRLLGLSADIDLRRAEEIAETLRLGGAPQYWLRADYAVAVGMKARAAVVLEGLASLPAENGLWGRILRAGHVAGLWGKPFVWSLPHGRHVFPHLGTLLPALRPEPP